MAIKMVREPSDTPNINNIDDIVPMRYAYGGQNGFVIGKGNEISNSVSGLNFTVSSGRLVLQGVECDIDATGVTITIDNIATKRYYTVYLEVNLGLNTATIKSKYDTATYPSIDAGDDLTENTTGVARLPLYQFTATSGIIGEINKVVESIKYTKDLKVNSAMNSDKINDIEIIQDEDGVLKVGDIIIPQKKLLWSGSEATPSVGTLQIELNNINVGDNLILEIQTEFGNYQFNIHISRIIDVGVSFDLYGNACELVHITQPDIDDYAFINTTMVNNILYLKKMKIGISLYDYVLLNIYKVVE